MTWAHGSWKTTGSANVWTPISADDELGYVYLPFSTPSNDWYGGRRPGAGLFGETLVCLDARTGRRVWHVQLVHHGLWDYDPPAAPKNNYGPVYTPPSLGKPTIQMPGWAVLATGGANLPAELIGLRLP